MKFKPSEFHHHRMAITLITRYSLRMIHLLTIARTMVAACLVFTALSSHAATDTYRAARTEFQRAYAQAQLTATPPEPDSDALRAYPLYSYVQAARIRTALQDAGAELSDVDQRAQTFIAEYANEAVAREVQRAWLASLSQRMLWETLLSHYPADTSDPALQCHSYSARIALNQTAGLDEDIRARWLTPKSLPECERAFEWLRAQNGLPAELIEQRARLALKNNDYRFARQIAAQLPPDKTGAVLQWAGLLEHPQRQIDHLLANPKVSVEREALLAGWTRLARLDRDGAKQRFENLVRTRKLSEADTSAFALALALPLAWDRRTDSLDYFARVQRADLDDTALEWYARAALWAQNWDLVSKTIASMSDASRGLARWRYWAARAAERLGEDELARQLFESLLVDDNFYSMMAAARLERALTPNPEKLVIDDVQLAQIQQLPELVRARELLLSSLQPLANTEWNAGLRRLAQDARKQAIHLAVRWGWYQQAIATATQQSVFNDYELLYPRPYDSEVRQAAKMTDLPEELIYGVMRQESLYRHDAVSSAGAHGLLQLLPETARRAAVRWKLPKPSKDDLFKPKVNVSLGAGELRLLMNRFNGQTLVALAGYNAGPNAAARWLPTEPIDPDIWVENIPYNETRSYVQRILWHSIVFRWLRTGEPQETQVWLARVEPLNPASVMGMAAE